MGVHTKNRSTTMTEPATPPPAKKKPMSAGCVLGIVAAVLLLFFGGILGLGVGGFMYYAHTKKPITSIERVLYLDEACVYFDSNHTPPFEVSHEDDRCPICAGIISGRMSKIDLDDCPDDFRNAYIAHREAWKRAAKARNYEEYMLAMGEVNSSFEVVEQLAKQHGARLMDERPDDKRPSDYVEPAGYHPLLPGM